MFDIIQGLLLSDKQARRKGAQNESDLEWSAGRAHELWQIYTLAHGMHSEPTTSQLIDLLTTLDNNYFTTSKKPTKEGYYLSHLSNWF
ncbi:MAG: hypothetical protein A3B31_01300 [Candidatus Komeilibacteria bacterium RIFCSPLOWO2_01_FULL_53_11]|uniref:Uncharacterized protein n=1 Tax=Candidatus Komeilibacteria bacterium RIFCSPLOWO2_01_FULL_53_11 TaxID=1798552 RepID=A0A1G2BPV7_9BACT|nr:MAG: hypothetical protein A3B31_01300 [Candidatus Komeilibacteria bacterium RIFCSPLOWO2_01_FULL_53_11]